MAKITDTLDLDDNAIVNLKPIEVGANGVPFAGQENNAVSWAPMSVYVDVARDELQADIAAEEAARLAGDDEVRTEFEDADTDLQANIDAEASARAAADTAIRTDFAAADTALRTDVTTVTDGLADEVTRATTAEGVLGTRVTAVEGVNTTQDDRLTALETATDDINVATQAELDALAGRVTTAESDISTLEADMTAAEAAIGAETTRATAEEADIRADMTAADTALGTQITDEIAARTAGDTANSSAITAETTRATTAEGALDTRVGTLEAVDTITQAEFDTEQTRVDDALALKADLVNGLVPRGQLPSIAIATVNVVADADERDALTADEGDIAVLADGGGTFIYDADANAGAGGWIPLASGAEAATDAELTAAIVAARAEWEAADDALQTAIDDLAAIDNATQEELDDAVALLEAADTANADALDDEVTRATSAEGVLDGRITTEVADRGAADTAIRTDFAAADTALQGAIDDEVTRATDAESVLQDNINAEATARSDADTALSGRISTADTALATEITNRTNADTALSTTINTRIDGVVADGVREHNDRVAEEARIEGLITTQSADVTADIAGLQAEIDAEETARATADSGLSGRLDTLQGDAATVGSVAYSVASEASARSAADTALDGRITTEITDRTNADSTLQGNITAGDNAVRGEFAAADTAVRSEFAAADTALGGRIDTEVTDRTDADADLQSQIDALDAAQYDDTALAQRVTDVEGDIATLNGDAATTGSVAFTADNQIAAQKGEADGLAPLGPDSKIDTLYLPALALTNVQVAADLAARDLLTGMDEGDVVIVQDSDGDGTRQTFIYDGTNWVEMSSPADVTEEELAAAVAQGLTDTVDELHDDIDGIIAGDGLDKTGTVDDGTLEFNVVGTPGRVSVGDSVDIDAGYLGQTSITTVGTITDGTWNGEIIESQYLQAPAGSTTYYAADLTAGGTSYTIPHALGGVPLVQVFDATTNEQVITTVEATNTEVIVSFSRDTLVDYRVVMVGGTVVPAVIAAS